MIIPLTSWLQLEPTIVITAIDDFHLFLTFVIRF